MAWACDRCGRLHTQNPAECRRCGHAIFTPVSDDELERRNPAGDTPESMDVEYAVGTAPTEDYESGPDVNPDGSVAGEERTTETNSARTGLLAWVRARLPF